MTRKTICLLIALVLLSACSSDPGTGEDECPDEAGCATVPVVPDVEHMELRQAWDQLVAADLDVEFKRELIKQGYEDYVFDPSMAIHPEPWVGDLDPEPGTEMVHDDTVRITAIECPNGAASCD